MYLIVMVVFLFVVNFVFIASAWLLFCLFLKANGTANSHVLSRTASRGEFTRDSSTQSPWPLSLLASGKSSLPCQKKSLYSHHSSWDQMCECIFVCVCTL